MTTNSATQLAMASSYRECGSVRDDDLRNVTTYIQLATSYLITLWWPISASFMNDRG